MRRLTRLAIVLIVMILSACSPGTATEITPTPTQLLNPLESPGEFLAQETGIPSDEITILDSEQVDWTNACLEAPQPDESCAQIIVPGYRISLDTPEGVYQIRTDETGRAHRILPPGDAPESETAVVWERSGGIAGICQSLTILFNREYELTDCLNEHTLNKGTLSADQFNPISDWLQTYTTFEFRSQPPESSADVFMDEVHFNGHGEQSPSTETQMEINDYLGSLATELTQPPTDIILDTDSGIQGLVFIGPVCPGPQPAEGASATQCADQPYQANLKILDQQENVVTTFQTDGEGRFQIALEPGDYEVVPLNETSSVFPRAATQVVTVRQGEFTQVAVQFDTGIR